MPNFLSDETIKLFSGLIRFSKTHISSAASSPAKTGSVSTSASTSIYNKEPNKLGSCEFKMLVKIKQAKNNFLYIKNHILNLHSSLNYNIQVA